MQPVEIVEAILQADSTVVGAATDVETSFSKGAPDVCTQILHAGFAGPCEIIECGGVQRAQAIRIALMVFEEGFDSPKGKNLRIDAIVFKRSVEGSLVVLIIQSANPDAAAHAKHRR